jgi:carbonic anhydrase
MSSGTLGVLRKPATIWPSFSPYSHFSFSVDALRSTIISQRLLGTREIAVVRHTDCGMLRFDSDQLRKVVKDAEPGDAAIAEAVDNIFFDFQKSGGVCKA